MLLPNETVRGERFSYMVDRAVKVGTLGVNLFFVLSGFLITYLLLTEYQRTGRIDVRAFYIRRALRIWPLYFATVGGWWLSTQVWSPYTRLPLVHLGLFAPNFAIIENLSLPPSRQWSLGPLGILWSVGIEEQFYLAWPLLIATSIGLALALLGKRERSESTNTTSTPPPSLLGRGPMGVCIGVCLLSLAARIAWKDRGPEGSYLYYHTFCVVGDMATGGLAACLVFCDERWPALLARLSRRAIVAGYLALALCSLVYMRWWTNPWVEALIRPPIAALFAFVILEQCYARNSFYKCGSSRLLSKLGTYTYGMYSLHIFALMASQAVWRALGWDQHLWQILLLQDTLMAALAILFGVLSYHLFEKPFLRLKRRFAHIQTT